MTTYNKKSDEQIEITFTNNHTAIVNASNFAESIALKNAIQSSFAKQKISFDMQNIDMQNIDISTLIQLLCMIDSDKQYNDCLQDCLKNCLYNNVPVNVDTFKPVNTRQNYYLLVASVIKMNIIPFFQNLTQLFTEFANTQTLKSQE
jgi:hypothetical protein